MAEQAIRGRFDEIEHVLEAVGSTVIRIWNFHGVRIRYELEKEPHLRARAAGRPLLERGQILAVHRENQIEAFEILALDASRAKWREIIATATRGFLRARIRRISDVISAGARRIDFDVQTGRIARHDCAEDCLRRRRATDVAEADEQDPQARYSSLPRSEELPADGDDDHTTCGLPG